MEKKKTHRKCPHCGGKTGFEATVSLGGTEIKKVKFSGKVFEDVRDAKCLISTFTTNDNHCRK